MSDEPEKPQEDPSRLRWKRATRSPLLDNAFKTLSKLRDMLEGELVREQEKLRKLKDDQQGGRHG